MIRGAGCDVGKCPSSLKLELWVVIALKELDEARAHTGVDDLLDRWATLCKG